MSYSIEAGEKGSNSFELVEDLEAERVFQGDVLEQRWGDSNGGRAKDGACKAQLLQA